MNFKKMTVTFFLFSILINCYTQETKLVKQINGDIKTKYYVLKSDKTIKHGSFSKYMESITQQGFLELGNFNNGLKEGEWTYFYTPYVFNSANNIKQKINYFNGKKNGLYLEYYRDSVRVEIKANKSGNEKIVEIDQRNLTLRTAGMYINDHRFGRWKSFDHNGKLIQDYDFSKKILYFDESIKDSSDYNLNRNALFIGSESKMNESLLDSFLFIKVLPTIEKDSTAVKIVFKIDQEGNVSDCKVENSNGKIEFENETIKAINTSSGNWIHAISEGIPVDTCYKIVFEVKNEKKESGPLSILFTCYSSF